MALKQTRRSVSLNRALYDAATAFAAERQITLAQLVADSLRAQGVDAPEQRHMPPMPARHPKVISPHKVLRRIVQLSSSSDAVESRGGGEICSREAAEPTAEKPKRYTAVSYRPSLERQMLGDQLANAMGFR